MGVGRRVLFDQEVSLNIDSLENLRTCRSISSRALSVCVHTGKKSCIESWVEFSKWLKQRFKGQRRHSSWQEKGLHNLNTVRNTLGVKPFSDDSLSCSRSGSG